MQTFVLYALVAAAVHYFLGFATITDRLRAPMPDAVLAWLYCPFCSGFWYGLALAVTVGHYRHLDLLGLPGDAWYTPIAAGFVTMITTPFVVGVVFVHHQAGVRAVNGSAEPRPSEPEVPEPMPPASADDPPDSRAM